MKYLSEQLIKTTPAKVMIEELQENASMEVLMRPVKELLEAGESQSIEEELFSLWLLIQFKAKTEKDAPKAEKLDFKALKTKLAKALTKPLLKELLEAVEILMQAEQSEEVKEVLASFHAQLTGLQAPSAKAGASAGAEDGKAQANYQNPHLREVLNQFESNGSVVYLMNLINKVYSEELGIGRLNRALSALEILSSTKQPKKIELLAMGNLNVQKTIESIKGSVNLAIVEICARAIDVMIHRQDSIAEMTPSLKATIKGAQAEFDKLIKNLKES